MNVNTSRENEKVSQMPAAAVLPHTPLSKAAKWNRTVHRRLTDSMHRSDVNTGVSILVTYSQADEQAQWKEQ